MWVLLVSVLAGLVAKVQGWNPLVAVGAGIVAATWVYRMYVLRYESVAKKAEAAMRDAEDSTGESLASES
jgi:hypothetical protein